MNAIATAITDTRTLLRERRDRGPTVDTPVRAALESGLRCTFTDRNESPSATDMPVRIGGSGSAPSPGYYLRGAIAACAVTAIAMRAAELDIELATLSATATSTSDGFAFLGLRDGAVGLLGLTIAVEVVAPGADPSEIDDLIGYALAHAPVSDSIERSVETTVEYDITSSNGRHTGTI